MFEKNKKRTSKTSRKQSNYLRNTKINLFRFKSSTKQFIYSKEQIRFFTKSTKKSTINSFEKKLIIFSLSFKMTNKITSFIKAFVKKKSFSIETKLSVTNFFQISIIKNSIIIFNEKIFFLFTSFHTSFKLVSSIKIQIKIRSFKNLKNDKENSLKYIENIEWKIEKNHNDAKIAEISKVLRLFFRQNLKNDAYIWYKNDIEIEIKLNWIQLRIVFLFEYKIIVKDVQTKKFELKMKMFQFKQKHRENIADYFKRISKLIRKMIKNEINVEMITLRDMKNQSKKKTNQFRMQQKCKLQL